MAAQDFILTVNCLSNLIEPDSHCMPQPSPPTPVKWGLPLQGIIFRSATPVLHSPGTFWLSPYSLVMPPPALAEARYGLKRWPLWFSLFTRSWLLGWMGNLAKPVSQGKGWKEGSSSTWVIQCEVKMWRNKTLPLLDGGRLSPCTGFRGVARPAWCPLAEYQDSVNTAPGRSGLIRSFWSLCQRPERPLSLSSILFPSWFGGKSTEQSWPGKLV